MESSKALSQNVNTILIDSRTTKNSTPKCKKHHHSF